MSSACLQESIPTVTSGKNPPLIYDYYGFPPESYSLKYPAPGNPALAGRVASLLRGAGFECQEDSKRGFDHGTFVPLLLSYPEADIPVVQLSLMSSLDPGAHIKMGEALAPLRDEGVLIYASGLSFHNMKVFMSQMGKFGGGKADPKSVEFDNYLKKAATGVEMPKGEPTLSWEEREELLKKWKNAPQARYAHPREEHLIPLMVAFGAAKDETATVLYNETLLGAQVSSFAFGGGAGADEGGAKQEL